MTVLWHRKLAFIIRTLLSEFTLIYKTESNRFCVSLKKLCNSRIRRNVTVKLWLNETGCKSEHDTYGIYTALDGQTPPILLAMSEQSTLYEGRAEKNRGVRTLRCSRGRHVPVFPLLRTLKQILYCDPNSSFLKNESVVSDARLRLYQYFPRWFIGFLRRKPSV